MNKYNTGQELFYTDSINAITHIQYQIKTVKFIKHHVKPEFAYIKINNIPILVSTCNLFDNITSANNHIVSQYNEQIQVLNHRVECIQKEISQIGN